MMNHSKLSLWSMSTAFVMMISLTGCGSSSSSPASGGAPSGSGAPAGATPTPIPILSGTTTGPTSADLSISLGYCVDFPSGSPAGVATKNCESAFSAGASCVASEVSACPTLNRIGSCTYTASSTITVIYRYYLMKITAAQAANDCKGLKGVFAP